VIFTESHRADMAQEEFFQFKRERGCAILQLDSSDHTNKLTRVCVRSLLGVIQKLQAEAVREEIAALIISGNRQFFSAGADLNEIAQLTGVDAFEFSRLGPLRAARAAPLPGQVLAVYECRTGLVTQAVFEEYDRSCRLELLPELDFGILQNRRFPKGYRFWPRAHRRARWAVLHRHTRSGWPVCS